MGVWVAASGLCDPATPWPLQQTSVSSPLLHEFSLKCTSQKTHGPQTQWAQPISTPQLRIPCARAQREPRSWGPRALTRARLLAAEENSGSSWVHGGRGLGPLEPAAWLGWVSPSDPLPHGPKGARRPAQASQKLSHPLLIPSPAAPGRLIPPKVKEKVAPPPGPPRPAPQPIPAAGTAPGRWPSPARPPPAGWSLQEEPWRSRSYAPGVSGTTAGAAGCRAGRGPPGPGKPG